MKKILYSLVVLCLSLSLLVGCQPAEGSQTGESQTDTIPFTEVDYAASVKLDMSSDSVKQEVTVKAFVDGDTTHFHVPTSVSSSGVLKARYLAINTPESTGKIEEWGKAASAFTKEKLSSAVSIVIESDDGNWNLDSTGSRYLVWVWYKTATDTEYRNLNIEILQNGLAIASSAANNRYGSTCTAAIAQAKAMKLHIYSGQNDPDFYYGEAVELTLKELRCHPEAYSGVKVAFEGVITRNNDNTVYVEAYDEETDMYYGIAVYYGFGLTGEGLNILSVGNLSRIVGTVQYYET
ncbi:MAG: thermonuclease family protein, partial [Eubacteriales bacterium]